MHIVRNTNITINNNGFMPMGGPMMPMGGPMMPMGMCGPSLFGCGFAAMPPNNDVAAGYCTGAAARMLFSTPGALKTVGNIVAWPFKMIGKGASWTYNHLLKPAGEFIWNKGLKPFGQFMWNKALKPLGQWIGGLFHKKTPEAENAQKS